MKFYPTVFEESVYMVGILPFAKGHQLYIAGYGIGVLNIAIVGSQGKVPQISFAFTDSFGINHDLINAINEFIEGHFEELIAEKEE